MRTTYTIGKLAKASGVPVSTVRYYEQRGLLQPVARTKSSYRVYGSKSLEQLRFMRAAQASGFTLENISKLIEIREGALDPCAEVKQILERRLQFPSFLGSSFLSKPVIEMFLDLNPVMRTLGSIEKLKAHPWFATVDWPALIRRETPTPF